MPDDTTPDIETERLIIRAFTEDDVNDFFLIVKDKEANTFLPWFPLETLEDALDFLREHYLDHYDKPSAIRYAVCLKTDNRPIGYVNVNDEPANDLGYGLRKAFWHKGIATEACTAVISQVRRTGRTYVTATHDVRNPQSGRVMKKIGMSYRYSYIELWQPKNILVTFRMYQMNLDDNDERVYMGYWNTHSDHFIESIPETETRFP